MNPFPARTLAALCDAQFAPATEVAELQNTRDFRTVFLGSDQGKRVLALIAHKCGWLQAGAPEQLVPFAEGRRSVMADIARIIDRDTERKVDDGRRDSLDPY